MEVANTLGGTAADVAGSRSTEAAFSDLDRRIEGHAPRLGWAACLITGTAWGDVLLVPEQYR